MQPGIMKNATNPSKQEGQEAIGAPDNSCATVVGRFGRVACSIDCLVRDIRQERRFGGVYQSEACSTLKNPMPNPARYQGKNLIRGGNRGVRRTENSHQSDAASCHEAGSLV